MVNGKTKKGLAITGISTAFIITLAIGYGEVKSGVNHNKEDVSKLEVCVKENKEEIDQEENINIQQAEAMKYIIDELKYLRQSR